MAGSSMLGSGTERASELLVALYENHNIHFADKANRPALEKDIAEIISALPLEATVRCHSICVIPWRPGLTSMCWAAGEPSATRPSTVHSGQGAERFA